MRGPLIAGILLMLVGAVWIGQGLGLLRGTSFMVDDLRWAVIGSALYAAGVILVLVARRRAMRPPPEQ
jgi:hypothetical protein